MAQRQAPLPSGFIKYGEEERARKLALRSHYQQIDDAEYPEYLFKTYEGTYKVAPPEHEVKEYEKGILNYVGIGAEKKPRYTVRPHFININDRETNTMIYYDQNRARKDTENMEDYYNIFDYPEGKVYVVLDGHGGDEAAKYIAEVIKSIFNQMFKENPEYISLIHDLFLFLNRHLREKYPDIQSGTTMTVIVHDKKGKKVYLANVGDSKAILFQGEKVLEETIDHRYGENVEEDERIDRIIESPNAKFKLREVPGKSPYIEIIETEIYSQNTRSLGDFKFGGAVIPVPFIYKYDLDDKEDVYLLVASDGLWDAYATRVEKGESVPLIIVNKINTEKIFSVPVENSRFKLAIIGNSSIEALSKDNIMIILSKLT